MLALTGVASTLDVPGCQRARLRLTAPWLTSRLVPRSASESISSSARIWGDACALFFSYHIHLDVTWFVVVHRLLFRMPEGNQRAPERSTACFLATYFLHCTSYTFAFVNFLHFERAMIPSCFFHCQNVRARMSACPLATYSPVAYVSACTKISVRVHQLEFLRLCFTHGLAFSV